MEIRNPYTRDNELRSLIIALLKKRMGWGIELFGLLSIDDCEDGMVRILDQRDPAKDICDGDEYKFKDVKKAVDFFLRLRDERRLGFDFNDDSDASEG